MNLLYNKFVMIYVFLWIGFLLTRLIIFLFPPSFSDVMYSYYHYARIWSEGYTPYLKHLFEYPPVNIIIFYLPRIIDRISIIDYPTSYRSLVFLVDLAIFVTIIKLLKKLKLPKKIQCISLLYYILATLKAKDFVYDSMDLFFISGLFFSLALLKLKPNNNINRFFSWVFFWLSTALKYITFPLSLPFLLMKKLPKLKKEIVISILSFAIIWALPLLVFRSSLSVSFVYHFKRGFQVESVPANIIRLLNSWTKTEAYVEVYKNYDIVGPLTDKLTPFLSLLFPLAMLGFLFYSLKWALKLRKLKKFDEYKQKLRLSLIYLFLFLLTGKVFSTPFHLWLPPLLAIFPYQKIKKQIIVLTASFLMIAISMTPIPNLKFNIFDVHTAIGITRPIILLVLLWQIYKS